MRFSNPKLEQQEVVPGEPNLRIVGTQVWWKYRIVKLPNGQSEEHWLLCFVVNGFLVACVPPLISIETIGAPEKQ